MNFYDTYILPKYLNFVMSRKDTTMQRPDVVSNATGVTLEIGFGSGLNLPYYKNTTKLYALDPSEELYDLAREQIKKVSFPVEHLPVSAENISLANNSVDSIVSTWSLCSIPQPKVALKEMLRVLKPGGKFTFIEHGKSPRNFTAKLQKFLTPISKRFAGGCHMDREIDTLIKEAGFEFQELEKFEEKSKLLGFTYKGVAIAKK